MVGALRSSCSKRIERSAGVVASSNGFSLAMLRSGWVNAAGQLAGFLAYDLVLIVPFLTRLPAVAPHFRLGLIIYTTVVAFSGALAIYYLFINRSTRLYSGS